MRRNHRGSEALEKAQDLYSQSREMAREGADRANTFIHQKPVLSTLLGVGAGFLIGLWLKRHD